MIKNGCGLLETPFNFFVDHLAPLCALLDYPILSSNPYTQFFYPKYYPGVHFKLKRWSLPYLLENFSYVLYSFVPNPSFKELIKEEQRKNPKEPLYQKPIQFVYHLHGCSDKGYHSNWIEKEGHFKDVDFFISYGERIEDILRNKELYHLPRKIVQLGNYRKAYYQKYKSFFDQKAHVDVFSKFTREKPILFYAPTWEDHENSCSVFKITPKILKSLTEHFNVLVKLHPNMTFKTRFYDPSRSNKWIEECKQIPHVQMLSFYPLVYPLIEGSDFYLGDYSSIGYDFLSSKKPMFFLNSNSRPANDEGAFLFRCGYSFEEQDFENLASLLQKKMEQPAKDKEMEFVYHYAFGKDQDFDTLKKRLDLELDHV